MTGTHVLLEGDQIREWFPDLPSATEGARQLMGAYRQLQASSKGPRPPPIAVAATADEYEWVQGDYRRPEEIGEGHWEQESHVHEENPSRATWRWVWDQEGPLRGA